MTERLSSINQEKSIQDNSILPSKKISPWLNFEKNEILLYLVYFMYGIAFANYEPYAPVWLGQFFAEKSYLIIGFIVIIPCFTRLIGSPFWGYLADKYGAKKFVIIGFAGYSLMFFSLIFTFSSTYFLVMILVGYLIGSASAGNYFFLATKSIAKPKGIILAKITIFVSIAYASMSPIAGWIFDNFSSSMIIQLIIAIVACLIAMLIALFVKETKANQEITIESITKEKTSKLTFLPVIFIGILVLTFFFQSSLGFWAYYSLYFLETIQIKGVFFSIYIIITQLLAIPISFLLGRVKKERSIGLIITCFTAYYILVFTLMLIFPINWILLIIFYSVPIYPIYDIFLYTLVANYSNEKKRGLAFGIFNVIGTLGDILGIIILGVIADNTSTGFLMKLWPKYIPIVESHESLEVLIMFIPLLALSTIAFLSAVVLFIFQFRKKKEAIMHDTDKLSEPTIAGPEAVIAEK